MLNPCLFVRDVESVPYFSLNKKILKLVRWQDLCNLAYCGVKSGEGRVGYKRVSSKTRLKSLKKLPPLTCVVLWPEVSGGS